MRFLLSFLLALICGTAPFSVAQENDISAVMAAQDTYAADLTPETRAALLSELAAYPGEATIETMNAYLTVLANDSITGDPSALRESGQATAVHLEPFADIVPKQYVDARFLGAVSAFNADLDPEALTELAHVEGFVSGLRDDTDTKPDWASALGYRAQAWRLAMRAYFQSMDDPHPSMDDIDAVLASYGADAIAINARAGNPTEDNALPHCPGRMRQSPALKYPYRKAKAGVVGAVILGLEFDPDGNVINPKVLASVPFEAFDAKSLRVVNQWRFKPTRSRDVGVTCRLERTNVVQPLVFLLD